MDTLAGLFHLIMIKKPSKDALGQKYLIMNFFFSLKIIELVYSSGSTKFLFTK